MKKGLMVLGLVFTLVITMSLVNVQADSSVTFDGVNYDIKLATINAGSVKIGVGGENSNALSEKTSPYYPSSVGGLDIIVKDIVYQSFVGGVQKATVWLGKKVTINLAEEKEVIIEGVSYKIEVTFIDYDEVQIQVNNQITSKLKEQSSSPYYFGDRNDAVNIQGLDIVPVDIVYQAFVGGKQEATFLVGKDVELSLEELEPTCSVMELETIACSYQDVGYTIQRKVGSQFEVSYNYITEELNLESLSSMTLKNGIILKRKVDSANKAILEFSGGLGCTDTDGKDYYTKGKVHWIDGNNNGETPDGCWLDYPKILIEVFCDGDKIKSEEYECPNGCQDGACIKSSVCSDIDLQIEDINMEDNSVIIKRGVGGVGGEIKEIRIVLVDGGMVYQDTVINVDIKPLESREIDMYYPTNLPGGQTIRIDIVLEDDTICETGTWAIPERECDESQKKENWCNGNEVYGQHCEGNDGEWYERWIAECESWGGTCQNGKCVGGCYDSPKTKEDEWCVGNKIYDQKCVDGEWIDFADVDCKLWKTTCQDGLCVGVGEGTLSPTEEMGPIEIPEDYICNGCKLDNKCYPFGYRKDGMYCSDETNFVGYKDKKESCDNNFECKSNVCVNSECISEGFLKKILNWFRRLFGGE